MYECALTTEQNARRHNPTLHHASWDYDTQRMAPAWRWVPPGRSRDLYRCRRWSGTGGWHPAPWRTGQQTGGSFASWHSEGTSGPATFPKPQTIDPASRPTGSGSSSHLHHEGRTNHHLQWILGQVLQNLLPRTEGQPGNFKSPSFEQRNQHKAPLLRSPPHW